MGEEEPEWVDVSEVWEKIESTEERALEQMELEFKVRVAWIRLGLAVKEAYSMVDEAFW